MGRLLKRAAIFIAPIVINKVVQNSLIKITAALQREEKKRKN